MLLTPLGEVKIYLDNTAVVFYCEKILSKIFPTVTTYHLKYNYVSDQSSHTLRCILENSPVVGSSESGEILETVAFDSTNPLVRLSIGIAGEFLGYFVVNGKLEPCYDDNYSYKGSVLENGLEIKINHTEENREYLFSVAWMSNYTDETACHTWFMADPSYIK